MTPGNGILPGASDLIRLCRFLGCSPMDLVSIEMKPDERLERARECLEKVRRMNDADFEYIEQLVDRLVSREDEAADPPGGAGAAI